MKQLTLSRDATRVLRRMPARTAAMLLAKIEQYAADPSSLANTVRALQGNASGLRRLRVGDYRIVFDETETVVAVIRTGPRGSVYE